MKLCPHCNAFLEENAARCSRCGKWVIGGGHREAEGRKTRKKGGSGRSRLLLLLGLVLVAWVVWRLPEAPIDPRELLESKPNQRTAIQAIRSDLIRLLASQEEYFRTHGEYSGAPGAMGFTASEGVGVSIIATPTGWSGTATHEDFPPEFGCAVFEGSARPPRSPVSPVVPGVIECTTPKEGP